MNVLALDLNETLVQAWGWALLHSLWQGGLIALLLRAFLPYAQRAAVRYWSAYGALIVLLAVSLITFSWVYQSPGSAGPAAVAQLSRVEMPSNLPVLAEMEPTNATTWQQTAGAWLENQTPLVVALWLIGLSVALLRLLGGWQFLYRLRRRAQPLSAPGWEHRLMEMSHRLAIGRPVRLLESALVQVPMTLGYFKPLILFPIGLINQLTLAEVEAIIAHELAHIARRDWLFNLLQTCLETLFYFNPAAWWFSTLIREERENCCDEMVIALTANRLAYAKALMRVQEQARPTPTPVLALALEGSRNLTWPFRRRALLLERVRRILNQTQSTTAPMEKTLASLFLLALLGFFALRGEQAPKLKAAVLTFAEAPMHWAGMLDEEQTLQAQTGPDSLPPARREKITRDDGNQKVELELENGKIKRLNIDGREIPAGQYAQYRELTDNLQRDIAPPPPPPLMPNAPDAPFPIDLLDAPAAPAFPSFAPTHLETHRDAEGNTVIVIDGPGHTRTITVKDGKVWIDGREVAEGETMPLNAGAGYAYHFGDGFVMPPMPPMPALAPTFQYAEAQLEQALAQLEADNHKMSKKERRQMERELRDAQRAMEREMRELETQQRRVMEETQREMERAQHEHRLAQQEVLRAQQETLRAQREAMREAQSAEREARAAEREARRAETVSKALTDQLLADKLIDDPKNFRFSLSPDEMRINGKKQAADVLKRYLELYEKTAGKKLSGGDRIQIEEEN